MHFNGVCASGNGVLQSVALLSSLVLEGFEDSARQRQRMSLSQSMSRSLTEKAGGGIMLKSNMGGGAVGGFFWPVVDKNRGHRIIAVLFNPSRC